MQAVTSELTLAETLVKPFMDESEERQDAYKRVLLSSSGLTPAPVTRAVLVEAARLRALRRFRLPDAIHVATALLTDCAAFISNDRRLNAVDIPIVNLAELA